NGVTIESVSVTGLGTEANPFIITINETDDEDAEVRITEIDDADLTDGDITENPAGHMYEYYAYDSQGNRYTVDYHFTKSGVNQWDYTVNVFDEDGTEITPTGGDTGTLVFDTAGALDEDETATQPLEFTPAGVDPMAIDLDFDNVSQLSGSSNLVVREQDGYGAGELAGFYIDRTGVVVGTYTNGLIDNLGQVQTATFANPEGLAKIGGNLFEETQNSGDAVVGDPGAGGRGLITASALEMSNTDLSFEFTELITTSRAFQANTRVVTTSDEVLVEVVNMKR
ncbi:MAG: flagellar hook-basal body complex protein, partial [Bacillota bacterium]